MARAAFKGKKPPRSPRAGGHGRAGVSEVFSTLMLVAIVVSLGVLVFTFASGGFSSITGHFTGLITQQGNAVDEHFEVTQVIFSFTGTTGATVYVRNVGTISSTIASVYIVDQTTGAFVKQVELTTAQGTLNVENVLAISDALLTFTPVHGQSYSFAVTSILGNTVTFDAKAS